ncbi:chorion protein S16 [Drosophila persimilis]|uniref:Chorion protein S16 n=1 Tax=Drosophila pseudoobscura pseudoobscura TaxID=46245 RepID=Q29D18_DROPS|nr:chorion protein S16 [Drosophila pseudoobscura]XP_002027535.2 chorion protein S16 [Drosophila persimilis]
MSANNMRLLCLLLACYISAIAAHRPSYRSGSGGYVDVVRAAETAEAQAAALTNAAGAAASAAKLDGADWHALNRYGWEQGRPLLAKRYGPLDDLYAAALPPRSFVAEIDPVFKKSHYGGAYGQKSVTLNTGAKVAVAALN